MRRKRRLIADAALCLVAAATLAGCEDRAPTGQVVASVDGDDITKRDLAFESSVTGLPPGGATLTAIVDRKLLAHRARAEKLDQTPEYLAAVRRFREATLATMLVQRREADAPAPDAAAIAAFVRNHDWMFARRALVLVEQAGDGRWIDTAAVADQREAARLIGMPVGATISLDGQPARLRARESMPMSPAQTDATARALLVRRSREALVRQLSEAEHRSARIRYQPGFGP